MDGQGTLHAADQRADKLERLLGAAERLGVAGCVSSVVMDLTQGGETPGLLPHYDLVVLDAPCTGVGVMRRHPEIKWRSDAWDAASLVSIQERMLDALAPRVAVGGVMVYCVCSFLPEEGVRQIDAFLARHPEFEAEGAEPGSGIPMRHGRGDMQTWPHLDDADAFYAARLRRRA